VSRECPSGDPQPWSTLSRKVQAIRILRLLSNTTSDTANKYNEKTMPEAEFEEAAEAAHELLREHAREEETPRWVK
jgi:hypothetical protein